MLAAQAGDAFGVLASSYLGRHELADFKELVSGAADGRIVHGGIVVPIVFTRKLKGLTYPLKGLTYPP